MRENIRCGFLLLVLNIEDGWKERVSVEKMCEKGKCMSG